MTITRRELEKVPAAAAIGLLVFASAAFEQDTTDAPMQRADALLRQMTVEEEGIPAVFHNEAMSGVVAPHFTTFPTSSGDPGPRGSGRAGRPHPAPDAGGGMPQALAPVMDVGRSSTSRQTPAPTGLRPTPTPNTTAVAPRTSKPRRPGKSLTGQ